LNAKFIVLNSNLLPSFLFFFFFLNIWLNGVIF
jgi:hypothetical protein